MASPQQNQTILHPIDTTGPGGAETVFLTLAKVSKENGCHSHALIGGPAWVGERRKAINNKLQVLHFKDFFNFRYLVQLLKTVRQLKLVAIQGLLLGLKVYVSQRVERAIQLAKVKGHSEYLDGRGSLCCVLSTQLDSEKLRRGFTPPDILCILGVTILPGSYRA